MLFFTKKLQNAKKCFLEITHFWKKKEGNGVEKRKRLHLIFFPKRNPNFQPKRQSNAP
jgi:hypothetical protein